MSCVISLQAEQLIGQLHPDVDDITGNKGQKITLEIWYIYIYIKIFMYIKVTNASHTSVHVRWKKDPAFSILFVAHSSLVW